MYQAVVAREQEIIKKLQKKVNQVSFVRVLFLLTGIYLFYLMLYRHQMIFGWLSLLVLVVFIALVSWFVELKTKLSYHKQLLKINLEEINFLDKKHRFASGEEFSDAKHAYTFDLDIFGSNSIFEFVNRTATFSGKKFLAQLFQKIPTTTELQSNQEAISELQDKFEFRQKFMTYAHLSQSEDFSKELEHFSTQKTISSPSKLNSISAIVFPLAFWICLLLGFGFEIHSIFKILSGTFFILNLILVNSVSGLISNEIGKTDKLASNLKYYVKMLELLEKEKFSGSYLKNRCAELTSKEKFASKTLKELSSLVDKLNTIGNIFVFIGFNGLFQYHFWVYKQWVWWRGKQQVNIHNYLQILSEVEAFLSLANFAYNNPEYVYPEISENFSEIHFENLGHPLLCKTKRVRNSVDFSNERFFILTGSNMSGKSTFLRTIGINLVLAYTGAPIDASKAVLNPIPLWVSMRLTDSLSDSESFFFAEVKRIKQIVEQAKNHPILVLLDEILKGTNSDDKKNGTIGVIEKLHQHKVLGYIATHDLEVCDTAFKHPNSMRNKCFEIEIKNNQLHFDYLLKEGICQNKNATFIMQQMGII